MSRRGTIRSLLCAAAITVLASSAALPVHETGRAGIRARFILGGFSTSASPAPVLLYTDIVSGSATNGEGGAGSYLTLYGLNFGTAANMCTSAGAQVTIGGAAVANCRYLVPAVTNGIRPGFPAVEALNVQIGSAAVQALTPGTTYTIGLTVNGVAANTTDVLGNQFNFVIQPGHFYFIDTVNGNDSTGVVDDITHPFRYIQKASGTTFTGVWAPGNFGPGDTEVIRGNGGTPITDQVGFDSRLMRYYNQGGTTPTGVVGHGYEAFTSYPGPINGNAPEDVYIFTAAGGRGGFMGADTVHARPNANDGQYWTVSNMRSSCDSTTGGFPSDASNFNMQNSADFTRFVNLNVQWPSPDTGTNHQKAGGIVGNGHNVWVLGNYIHNISGGDPSALENHGVYLDGSNTDAAEVEVGFNVIVGCLTGQCIQFHSEASDGFANVWVHHNWAENSAKYGVKIDGFSGLFWMWDNVVVGSVRDGFGFDNETSGAAGPTTGFAGHVENNTFYNSYSTTVGPQGMLVNEGQTSTLLGTIDFSNNILAYGPGTSGYTAQYTSFSGAPATLHGNVYFDSTGRLTSKPAADTTGVYGNTQLANTATFPNFDPRLGITSIAIGRAVGATINPVNDYGMNPQPRTGQTVNSVGAAQ